MYYFRGTKWLKIGLGLLALTQHCNIGRVETVIRISDLSEPSEPTVDYDC